MLFDEKLAWEKPCGGGLTYKAYSQYPFLIENATPKRFVTETVLAAPQRRRGHAEARRAAADLFALRPQPHAAGARRARRRADRKGARARAWSATARAGSCAPPAAWRTPISASSPPARAIRCATSARSSRRADTMSALGYYVPGEQEQHRHPVSAGPRRLHLGLPALRPSLGGHLRQGRAGRRAAQAAGSVHGRARHLLEGRGVLQPSAALARDHVVEVEPRGGRRLDGGGRRRRPGGSDHRRRPLLRDPLRRPGGAERCWPTRRSGRKLQRITAACCAAISPPTWSSARGWPSASSSARFLFGARALAHGAVHAPQSRASPP